MPSAKKSAAVSPEEQLASFFAKYTPEVAALGRAALEKMRARLPGATELVYDGFNALAIGFGPGERTSEAIFSIALYPRWVNLFFLQARGALPDPEKLLKGSGNLVRSIRLEDAEMLDHPAVQALIAHALRAADVPIDSAAPRRLIVRAVSPKQRPRRPRGL